MHETLLRVVPRFGTLNSPSRTYLLLRVSSAQGTDRRVEKGVGLAEVDCLESPKSFRERRGLTDLKESTLLYLARSKGFCDVPYRSHVTLTTGGCCQEPCSGGTVDRLSGRDWCTGDTSVPHGAVTGRRDQSLCRQDHERFHQVHRCGGLRRLKGPLETNKNLSKSFWVPLLSVTVPGVTYRQTGEVPGDSKTYVSRTGVQFSTSGKSR